VASLEEGEDAQALLNYHEAFNIFSDFKNSREQGVCLNNIGSIFMRRHEYQKAYSYFTRSTQLQIKLAQENDCLGTQNITDNILLACRLYQEGFSLFMQLKKFIKSQSVEQQQQSVNEKTHKFSQRGGRANSTTNKKNRISY
jgi:tetratricopeptide (TPR) repeat protein